MTRGQLIQSLVWLGNHIVFTLLTTLIVGILGGTLYANIYYYYMWDTVDQVLVGFGLCISWIISCCVLGMLGSEVWKKLETWANQAPNTKIVTWKAKQIEAGSGQLSVAPSGQLSQPDITWPGL